MKRYTVVIILCGTLLAISIAARLLLLLPNPGTYFPYLMWVHVAIIVLGFYGFWTLHKIRLSQNESFWSFFRKHPAWLLAIAVAVIYLHASIDTNPSPSLGTTPEGKPVYSKSWLEENGRHYVILNQTIKLEISEAERLEAKREFYKSFSSGWILFSYVILILWLFIWKYQPADGKSTLEINSKT
jgi:hypothetical protein